VCSTILLQASHFSYVLHVLSIWFSLVWYLYFRPINQHQHNRKLSYIHLHWVTSTYSQPLLVWQLGVPQSDYRNYFLLKCDAGSPVDRYRSFAGANCLHLQSRRNSTSRHNAVDSNHQLYAIFFGKVKRKAIRTWCCCFRTFWIRSASPAFILLQVSCKRILTSPISFKDMPNSVKIFKVQQLCSLEVWQKK
jgi:hypothetical protein